MSSRRLSFPFPRFFFGKCPKNAGKGYKEVKGGDQIGKKLAKWKMGKRGTIVQKVTYFQKFCFILTWRVNKIWWGRVCKKHFSCGSWAKFIFAPSQVGLPLTPT